MKDINKLVEIFVKCDDFHRQYEKFLSARSVIDPLKKLASMEWALCPSEVMAICIYYHLSGYKCFKYYYKNCVLGE
jgi:hypothetical protein